MAALKFFLRGNKSLLKALSIFCFGFWGVFFLALLPLSRAWGAGKGVQFDDLTLHKPQAPMGSWGIGFRLTSGKKSLGDSDLNIVHEKKVHVLVFDPSLTEFFHVHPKESNGIWKATDDLVFRRKGRYFVFAEGELKGGKHFLGTGRVNVPDAPEPALPRPLNLNPLLETTVEGTVVTLSTGGSWHSGDPVMASLSFKKQGGAEPVSLTPYLGALAHVVVVSLEKPDLVHVHPMPSPKPQTLDLHLAFKRPGDYRVWVQFQEAGKLKVAPLAVRVTAP